MIKSKVMIFGNFNALYLQDLTYDEEKFQYAGYVLNGAWYAVYNTDKEFLTTDRGEIFHNVKLLWIGDAGPGCDYNEVIENARFRYESGEPSNYSLTQVIEKRDLKKEIPF